MVTVSEVAPSNINPALRILTDELGASDVAINVFEVPPSEPLSGGYHAHHDQEELFYAQSGAVTFETDDGDVQVREGEIVRFAPGDFHYGYNHSDEPAVVLAVGAPPNSREVESVRECLVCGSVFHHHRTAYMGVVDDPVDPRLSVECPRCGGETRRRSRPERGSSPDDAY